MDHLARLIAVCLLACAFWAPEALAIGSIASVSGTSYTTTDCVSGETIRGADFGAAAATCAGRLTAKNPPYSGNNNGCAVVVHPSFSVATSSVVNSSQMYFTFNNTKTFTTAAGYSCNPGAASVVAGGGAHVFAAPAVTCDGSSSVVGSGSTLLCACALGTKPAGDGKSCVPYQCGAAGTYSSVTQPDQQVGAAGDAPCTGGCGSTPSGWKTGTDGRIWALWPFYSTGKACGGAPLSTDPRVDTGEQNSTNPAPVACGANMCPGAINGANVCVACNSQQIQGPTTSASAPAGAASGAATGSTTQTTSCDGITCTTTTTTRDASGATTGTTTEAKDQKSFCQEHPSLQMCKDSLWGGSCQAGFSCDGDAVQCALTKRVFQTSCNWETRIAALNDPGDAALAGGLQPDGHPAKAPDAVPMAFGTLIDQTEYFAGSCVADMTVPLGVGSVTIPFSQLCGSLIMLGNVMVGLCMLAAAFITFRS